MSIDEEIKALTDLRLWLIEHKSRLLTLSMMKDCEKSISSLSLTIKRLKTTKKLCEAKQSKLDL